MSGAQILGAYPDKLKEHVSDVNLGRGRIMPTTSWEAVWLGLAQWMGVPSSDMSWVLPNAENFPDSTFSQSDLFDEDPVTTTNTVSGTTASSTPAPTTPAPGLSSVIAFVTNLFCYVPCLTQELMHTYSYPIAFTHLPFTLILSHTHSP